MLNFSSSTKGKIIQFISGYFLYPFGIIGLATEATNENGKSAEDLGKLWEQFYTENIPSKITNKILMKFIQYTLTTNLILKEDTK